MIPIFCVNLERAKERKELIQKKWIDQLGFKITFWNGYDRRHIENNKFVYQYDKNLAIQNLKRELNAGEIACSTSFCMLYQHILDNNYEEAIIMEDDVSPLIENKKDLFETIREGKKEFPESEMILLHKPYKPHEITVKKQYTSKCGKSSWGNQLFFVKKSAVIKAYNILKLMFLPADHPQLLLSKQQIVTVSNKGLCSHHWNGDMATTYIGNDLRSTKRKFIP